jgi:hypothetical protein
MEAERGATRDELAEFNVLASYPTLERARASISGLEQHGFEAADISLLGADIDRAREHSDTSSRDAAVVGHVGRRAAQGAALGTIGGAVAGLLAGLVAFAIPGIGPVAGSALWAATLAGGVAGGAVGGVAGGIAGTDMNREWELTFDDLKARRVVVGVHTDDPEGAERASRVLATTEPLRVTTIPGAAKRQGGSR